MKLCLSFLDSGGGSPTSPPILSEALTAQRGCVDSTGAIRGNGHPEVPWRSLKRHGNLTATNTRSMAAHA